MHSGTAFQDFWFTIKLVGLTEVHQHSRTEKQLVHMSKRPRSPGGRCHHFRKFCEMMKQSKMETRKQPWAPTPPCKHVNGRAHPAVQAERDNDLAWTQKQGPCPSLTLVALWHLHCQYHCLINRRFLPHRLYPASPNTLLYLKLSQDKNRGRLSSWGKHQRKTSPHGSERQRLSPQWDTLLYSTTTTTAGEDHRRGAERM